MLIGICRWNKYLQNSTEYWDNIILITLSNSFDYISTIVFLNSIEEEFCKININIKESENQNNEKT